MLIYSECLNKGDPIFHAACSLVNPTITPNMRGFSSCLYPVRPPLITTTLTLPPLWWSIQDTQTALNGCAHNTLFTLSWTNSYHNVSLGLRFSVGLLCFDAEWSSQIVMASLQCSVSLKTSNSSKAYSHTTSCATVSGMRPGMLARGWHAKLKVLISL